VIADLDDALREADANWEQSPSLRAEFSGCSNPKEAYRSYIASVWNSGGGSVMDAPKEPTPFERIKASIAAIGSEQHRLEKREAALQQVLLDLDELPLPRDDFAAMVAECIDMQADSYTDKLSRTLMGYVGKINMDPSTVRLPFLGALGTGGDNNKVAPDALMFFCRDAMKKAITETIAAVVEWPKCGPARSERPALREKADIELAGVEKELAELKAESRKAGLR